MTTRAPCVTEEFYPGFRNSTAAYTVGLLQPKIIRALKLGEQGLRIVERRAQNFPPLPDGQYLLTGEGRTGTEIAKFSTKDAARYSASKPKSRLRYAGGLRHGARGWRRFPFKRRASSCVTRSKSASLVRLSVRRREMHAMRSTAILFCSLLFAAPAGAATCGGDFGVFLGAMSREAAAAGISRTVTDSAFGGLTQDGAVLAFDRRQRGTFRKTFEEYAATRVVPARINRARQLMRRHAALLARIERQFGVPATLLMAIWTLESDNGTGDMGKLPVIRTLATLAHDCRRTELFQSELLAALQIVQRGDLGLRELIGAYAGEIGQTQFLPSSYIKYGVDYDGDGRVDLRRSVPDVLASTANLLKSNGWRAGAPFGEGTANFEVMREWNRSVVYRKTMALFAERLTTP